MKRHILKLLEYARNTGALRNYKTVGRIALRYSDADLICEYLQEEDDNNDYNVMQKLVLSTTPQEVEIALHKLSAAVKDGHVSVHARHAFSDFTQKKKLHQNYWEI